MPEPIRVSKLLAEAGVASRRAADALVAAGRVTVNGTTATVGQRVDPAHDQLAVDGRPIERPGRRTYLVMNKPVGVTSTVRDRHAERTVLDLVPPDAPTRSAPLPGRSPRPGLRGADLLTDDGDWTQRLLHPSHGVEREYAVGVTDPLDAGQRSALEAGVVLEEGLATLAGLRQATRAESGVHDRTGVGPALAWYRAVLTQGWKRQIRRMFEAVGSDVVRLVRVRIGTLRLGDLAPGTMRPLTRRERDGSRKGRPRPVNGFIVSLDGPGSSGKSSVGAAAAHELGFHFLDTGVLYRALTLLAVERSIDPEDQAALVTLVDEISLGADAEGSMRRVLVDGTDVTDRLHAPEVDRAVSAVSRQPAVRSALLGLQRRLAGHGLIVAGRDIGSVVLPDADLKLYLDVSLDERARRRSAERGLMAEAAEATAIRDDLERRDLADSTRAVAPLRVPEGALVIRSDGKSFAETVAAVVQRGPRGCRRDRPMSGKPRLLFYHRLVAALARLGLRSIARVRVEGLEHVPTDGPLIIVANHMSNADPPLLWGWLVPALGRVPTYLAKAVLFKGIAGAVLRSVGASPVEAGGSDMAAYRVAKAVLDAGGVVTLMPEGTRSLDGRLLTAMPGASLLATRTGATVLPVGISGTDELLGRAGTSRGSGRASRFASDDRSRSRSVETTGGPLSRRRTRKSCGASRRSSTRAIAASGSPGRMPD